MVEEKQEEKTVEHSPLPWKPVGSRSGWLQICDANGQDIIDINSNDGADEPTAYPEEENRAFILRAVNNYETLVTALRKALRDRVEAFGGCDHETMYAEDCPQCSIRAALASIDSH